MDSVVVDGERYRVGDVVTFRAGASLNVGVVVTLHPELAPNITVRGKPLLGIKGPTITPGDGSDREWVVYEDRTYLIQHAPDWVSVCERVLSAHRRLWEDTQNILSSHRNILGVPEMPNTLRELVRRYEELDLSPCGDCEWCHKMRIIWRRA